MKSADKALTLAGQARPLELGNAIKDPEPLTPAAHNWTRLIGCLVSVLVLGAVAYQLRTLQLTELYALVPTGFAFWIVFACYYAFGPATEWIIFRRLWSIPISGIGALLLKQVSNEILIGYTGEVYFYAWARRNAHVTADPFGVIKDLSVLSAMVGNAITLVMMIAMVPLIGKMHIGISGQLIALACTVLFIPLVGTLIFRNKIFSLSNKDLWFVIITFCIRVLSVMLLAAVMWYMLIPTVPIYLWVLFGTLRLIVSRIPLIANKDMVFAGLTTFIVGKGSGIGSVMTLMATFILATHLVVGALLGVADLVHRARAK